MTILRILLIVLLFLVTSCTSNSDRPSNAKTSKPVQINDGVLFPGDFMENYICESAKGAYWSPSAEDIGDAEKTLEKYVEDNDIRIRPLDDYYRQYQGMFEKGEKIIVVGAFCKERNSRDDVMGSGPMYVFGGGDCYFHFTYQPSSGNIYGFFVNAPE